ncbi:MAG: phasin family protein [Acidobacteria bacterium]|nr:phasin family protein [Acidobacteriota bacterium]
MDSKRTLRSAGARLEELGREARRAGRNVWLAGLGAASEVETHGRDAFDAMVRRGEAYEARRRRKIEDALDVASGRARRVREWFVGTVEQGVDGAARGAERTLERMGVPTREDIATLGRRIDRLSREVEALGER